MDRDVVLVSGAPGSGKSTLAAELARVLDVTLLSKDLIKESLWDTFAPPGGDVDWSRRLGGAAMELLWVLAAHSPRMVLEANFRPHSEYERAKLRSLSERIVEVHCWCPPDVAMRRYAARAESPSRHPAHVTTTLDPALLAEFDQPVGIGTLVRVDTTEPTDLRATAGLVVDALGRPAR